MPPAARPRPRHPMPADIRQLLEAKALTDAYRARPAYQRNDYVGWIGRAKLAPTRAKRLRQMLTELRRGDSYMGMKYHAKKP